MSLLSRVSPLGSEVGLQVLLAAGTSSVLARFANVAVGTLLPVYQSIKSLEDRVQPLQRKWLGYWSVYGCLHATETCCSSLIQWIPFYHHVRLGFLIWLQLPPDYGFVKVYCRVLRPLFTQFRPSLDPALNRVFRNLAAVERSYRAEIRAVGSFAKQAAFFVASTVKQGIDAISRSSPTVGHPSDPSPFAELAAPPGLIGNERAPQVDAVQPSAGEGGPENAESSDNPGWVHVPSAPHPPPQ